MLVDTLERVCYCEMTKETAQSPSTFAYIAGRSQTSAACGLSRESGTVPARFVAHGSLSALALYDRT